MKRNLLLIMITIFLSGAIRTGFAKEPSEKSAMSTTKEIQKIITESVKYPDFGYKNGLNGDVTITFTVSAEGMIELKKINSQSEELKEYVKNELTKITIKDIIHPLNQQYKVKLKFGLS
jgi:hypothetical protein